MSIPFLSRSFINISLLYCPSSFIFGRLSFLYSTVGYFLTNTPFACICVKHTHVLVSVSWVVNSHRPFMANYLLTFLPRLIYLHVQLINITAAFMRGKFTTTCKHKVMNLLCVWAVKLNAMRGPKRGSRMRIGHKSIIVHQYRGMRWTEFSAYVWGVGKTYQILGGKSKRKRPLRD